MLATFGSFYLHARAHTHTHTDKLAHIQTHTLIYVVGNFLALDVQYFFQSS